MEERICCSVDGSRGDHSKESQTEKGGYMLSLRDGIYNNGTRELVYQIEADSQAQKTSSRLPQGKARAGISAELGISRYMTTYKR